jgi:hypothetical protein
VIPLHEAVAEADDALGMRGDVVFVRYKDNRAAFIVEPLEHLHDLFGSR